MKKRIFSILLINVLFLLLSVPVCAQGSETGGTESATESHPARVVDEADILTWHEEDELIILCDEISERQQFDVVITVVNTLEGQSSDDYAADYYDYHGYGMGEDTDGIMLLVSMEEREWFMLTTGYGMEAFSDYDLDEISDEFLSYLSEGDYLTAFEIFAESCDEHLDYVAENGVDNYSDDGYSGDGYSDDGRYSDREAYAENKGFSVTGLLKTIVLALILAFIPVTIMKGNLKSVKFQEAAGVYIKPGSEKITLRRDQFLYHTINRVPRPKENHSHSSGSSFRGSSGRSHGGRGGGF